MRDNFLAVTRCFFQNEDIGNFAGWEVLVRRLKDDRSVAKEYAEFLRQR